MSISQDLTNRSKSLSFDRFGHNILHAGRGMEGVLPVTERFIDSKNSTGQIANRILNPAARNPGRQKKGLAIRNMKNCLLDPRKSSQESTSEKRVAFPQSLPICGRLFQGFWLGDNINFPCLLGVDLLNQKIKDTNLVVMFSHLDISDISKKLHPKIVDNDLTGNAARIRIWMSENPKILRNITKLNLSHSNLTLLPPEIKLLTRLKVLVLEGSPITSLPEDLDLPDLQKLILSNTSITSLPKRLILPSLWMLDLSNTLISSWPDTLALPKLQRLHLFNTPLDLLARLGIESIPYARHLS